MTYLQRVVVVHQEQQQRAQDERLERLEQMLNGSIDGQRRLEMQANRLQQQQERSERRLAVHVTDKIHEVQLEVSNAQEEILVQDERMERLEQMLNKSTEGQRHLEMHASDQNCQRQSAEQLEIITASMASIRHGVSQIINVIEESIITKTQNAVVGELSDFATNVSQQLTAVGQSCIGVGSSFGEVLQAQTELHSVLLELHQQAVVSNVSRLLEAAQTQLEIRKEDTSSAIEVALENVTTHLREIQDRSEEVSEDRLTRDLLL